MSLCNMCGGSSSSPNYAKTVDPPIPPYGTILGDGPSKQNRGYGVQPACIPIQMCLPQISNLPQMGGCAPRPCQVMGGGGGACQSNLNATVHVPRDFPKACPQIYCEPCPPRPPTKVWLIKSSPIPPKVGLNKLLMFILSFAIAQPPPCNPCSRPIIIPCRPYC